MKFQIAIGTILVILGVALAQKKKPGFEEMYRQMPKADLKAYVKIYEAQVKDIPDFEPSDCASLRDVQAEGTEAKHGEYLRYCIYYINLVGMAEGIPAKGLAWPVEGTAKENLDEDAALGVMAMYAHGLLKGWKPDGGL